MEVCFGFRFEKNSKTLFVMMAKISVAKANSYSNIESDAANLNEGKSAYGNGRIAAVKISHDPRIF